MTTNIQYPMETSLEVEHIAGGPGKRLRQARENEHLTKSDVASRLHLRGCIIDALEADDYNNTPELVFVRGYLRAYANLVNLPADEIIASFNELNLTEIRPERVLRQVKKSSHFSNFNYKDLPVGWLSAIITGCLLTIIALWWHSQGKDQVASNTKSTISSHSVVMKIPEASTVPSIPELPTTVDLANTSGNEDDGQQVAKEYEE